MKILLTLTALLFLSSCFNQVVRVHTARNTFKPKQYREIMNDIHQEIMKSGHSSGAHQQSVPDHSVLIYKTSEISTPQKLRGVIRYIVSKYQKDYPKAFRLLEVRIVDED
jgi:hypothetical protein